MMVDAILNSDPEARTMTLQFTTLRAPAGVVSMTLSPQGKTDPSKAPVFNFTFTSSPTPATEPAVVPHGLDPEQPSATHVHPSTLSRDGSEKVRVTVANMPAGVDLASVRVVIGKTLCPVSSISVDASRVATLAISSPRGTPGVTSLLVFAGRAGIPSSALVATASVLFVDASSYMTAAAALPAHAANTGGEAVALVLTNVPFGTKINSFRLELAGVRCELTGLVPGTNGDTTLYFTSPAVAAAGAVTGTVTMVGDAMYSVSSSFAFSLVEGARARVSFAYPTAASTAGGTKVPKP